MKTFKNNKFRELYNFFNIFEMNDAIREAVKDFPHAEDAAFALGFCYNIAGKGLVVEFLGTGNKKKDGYALYYADEDIRAILPISAIDGVRFAYGEPSEKNLKEIEKKMKHIGQYFSDKEIEKTRSMEFLDSSRDANDIDIVNVIIKKNNLKDEPCKVRITGLGEHRFKGILLEEPKQDFSLHKGDKIDFGLEQIDKETVICCLDLRRKTIASLAGGKALKEAISRFNKDRSSYNLFLLLEILRNSYVWIPCNAVIGEKNEAVFQEFIQSGWKEGDVFTSQDDIRLVPDILQNGEDLFFPVFSSKEEMGEYGEMFSKVEQRFMDVLDNVEKDSRKLKGIVVNAYTESFVVIKDIYDSIRIIKPFEEE